MKSSCTGDVNRRSFLTCAAATIVGVALSPRYAVVQLRNVAWKSVRIMMLLAAASRLWTPVRW